MYYLSFRKQKFNTSSLSLDMKMVNTIHLCQDNYLEGQHSLTKVLAKILVSCYLGGFIMKAWEYQFRHNFIRNNGLKTHRHIAYSKRHRSFTLTFCMYEITSEVKFRR